VYFVHLVVLWAYEPTLFLDLGMMQYLVAMMEYPAILRGGGESVLPTFSY
jgi:hypothetical protein